MRLVPTVSVLGLRPLIALLAARGVPASSLIERLRLGSVDLFDDEARIKIHKLVGLWSTAETLLDDPDVGLHAAEHATFESFRALSSLAAASPTLGSGLVHVERYVSRISGLRTYTLENAAPAENASLRLVRHRFVPSQRHAVEFLLAVPHLYCLRASQTQWALDAVHFTHPRPASTKEHTRIFGAALRFETDHDGIHFNPRLLESSSRFRDDALAALLLTTEERLARASSGADVVAAARVCIWERLREGDVSVAGAARAMAMSERTLQRELSRHGTSHRQVLDEVRAAFAEELLRTDTSLFDVALLLRFAEQTAFQRAFKRWTGLSPVRWKAAHGARSR